MNAAPPKISNATSANNLFAAIVLGAVALGIAAIIFFFNPTTHGFYPVCQFHKLTGLNCPGCGATRALYALLHGNFLTALRDNALFVSGIFWLVLRGTWFAAKKFRGQPTADFFPTKLLWPLLFITFVFTVLRNLPAFSFLSPA
jgi:Protein of unknown function (DUF2752)